MRKSYVFDVKTLKALIAKYGINAKIVDIF